MPTEEEYKERRKKWAEAAENDRLFCNPLTRCTESWEHEGNRCYIAIGAVTAADEREINIFDPARYVARHYGMYARDIDRLITMSDECYAVGRINETMLRADVLKFDDD